MAGGQHFLNLVDFATKVLYDFTGVNSISSNFFVDGSGNPLTKQSEFNLKITEGFVGLGAQISSIVFTGLTRDKAQTAHGLAIGDLVKLSGGSDSGAGTYQKALASEDIVAIIVAVADADNFTLGFVGYFQGFSGLSPPSLCYASNSSAGAITTTKPTAVGDTIKPVLVPAGTTRLMFIPTLQGFVIGLYPKRLFDHYADAGNTTTSETDLYSDTVAAGELSANGQKIKAQYGGIFVSSGTATRQIRLYFGGTAIFDSGTLSISASAAWSLNVTLIRVSSSVVRYVIELNTQGAALSAYTSVGELTGLTLSGTNVLKVTGQAAGVGAATNDIVAKLGSVEWVPAV